MELRITSRHGGLGGGTWYVGRVGSYHFEALVFAEPSRYGIDCCPVSKLFIFDGPQGKRRRALVVYEREWEVKPTEGLEEMMIAIIEDVSRRERERYQTADDE